MNKLILNSCRSTFEELNEPGRRGLLITQNGRTYFARGHQLSEQTVTVIMAAVNAGFTAFWKYGHPGDQYFEGGSSFHSGAHQIHFGVGHDRPWTFVIGSENKPPFIREVTFNKKLEMILNTMATQRGLTERFQHQVVGGKNLTVKLEQLDYALDVCA